MNLQMSGPVGNHAQALCPYAFAAVSLSLRVSSTLPPILTLTLTGTSVLANRTYITLTLTPRYAETPDGPAHRYAQMGRTVMQARVSARAKARNRSIIIARVHIICYYHAIIAYIANRART